MKVYLDCEDTANAPALEFVMVQDTRWNGWLIPVVTAKAFRDFIVAMQSDDPNGTFYPNGIWVNADSLCYDDGQSGSTDSWERIGETVNGTPVYALSGWCWIYDYG